MRMSTRNANRATIKVGRQRINNASKYFGECPGVCRCARTLRTRRIRVIRAAIGWTMSRFVSEFLALLGNEKSDRPSLAMILSKIPCQSNLMFDLHSVQLDGSGADLPILYPNDALLHPALFEHHPNTPNLTPPKLAMFIAWMIGALRVLKSSSTKAASSNTLRGVAGRSNIA